MFLLHQLPQPLHTHIWNRESIRQNSGLKTIYNETGFISQQITVWTLTPTPTNTPIPTATLHPFTEFDLDGNGEIEIGDLLDFIECMSNNDLRCDFNDDGIVDRLDLFILSNGWGYKFDRKWENWVNRSIGQ